MKTIRHFAFHAEQIYKARPSENQAFRYSYEAKGLLISLYAK